MQEQRQFADWMARSGSAVSELLRVVLAEPARVGCAMSVPALEFE